MSENVFKPERVFEAGPEGPAKQLKGKELEEWEEKQLRERLRREHSAVAKTELGQDLIKISGLSEEKWIERTVENDFERIMRMREERKKEQEK